MYDIKAFYEAQSVQDAVRLRLEHPQAQILAGGTDVLAIFCFVALTVLFSVAPYTSPISILVWEKRSVFTQRVIITSINFFMALQFI